ncbi:hypothetical protein ACJ41O_013126 [Fusarium nematophilum]
MTTLSYHEDSCPLPLQRVLGIELRGTKSWPSIHLKAYCYPPDGFRMASPTIVQEPTTPSSKLFAKGVISAEPWLEVNSFLNATAPYGRRIVTRGTYFSALTEAMVDNMIAAALCAPKLPTHGPSSVQELWIYAGGAITEDFDEDSCAFSREGALGFYEIVAQWDRPDADEENLSWANKTADVVTRDCLANGYSNFSWDLGLEWRRGLFGKLEKWERLVTTKKKWDPKNPLRFNKNFPVD